MIILRQANFSSAKIRQRMFSEEERAYALIPDLVKYGKTSGFKRVWNKNIGEYRVKIADKAIGKQRRANSLYSAAINKHDYINKELQNLPNTREDYLRLRDHLRNKENYMIVDKTGARVRDKVLGNHEGFTLSKPQETIKETEDLILSKELKFGKKRGRIRSSQNNKGYYDLVKYGKGKSGVIVVTGENKSAPTLAHETGHNINRIKNNLSRIIKDKTRGRDGGIVKSLATLNEEVQASKKGLRKMERVLGRKPTNLEKQSLNAAADTYRYGGEHDFWKSIADKINIPSRKSTALYRFSGYTKNEQLSTPSNYNIFGKVLRSGRTKVPAPTFPKVNYTPTQYIK